MHRRLQKKKKNPCCQPSPLHINQRKKKRVRVTLELADDGLDDREHVVGLAVLGERVVDVQAELCDDLCVDLGLKLVSLARLHTSRR